MNHETKAPWVNGGERSNDVVEHQVAEVAWMERKDVNVTSGDLSSVYSAE